MSDELVQLQVNTLGAWRQVLTFGALDNRAGAMVRDAALLLHDASGGRADFRLATVGERVPRALMYLSTRHGGGGLWRAAPERDGEARG